MPLCVNIDAQCSVVALALGIGQLVHYPITVAVSNDVSPGKNAT